MAPRRTYEESGQIASYVASVACKALMELSSSAVMLVWRWFIGTCAEIVMPHSDYIPYRAVSPTVGCLLDEPSAKIKTNPPAES